MICTRHFHEFCGGRSRVLVQKIIPSVLDDHTIINGPDPDEWKATLNLEYHSLIKNQLLNSGDLSNKSGWL